MLDLALASSKEAAELSFEAWTERIPAKGTPVVIVLKPVAAKAAPATPATDKPKAEKPEEEKPADPARKKPAPETAIKD
ncbi:MAG: hypothetical protein ACKOGA_24895, partial [Planctomycetaceae bacterium]